MLIETPLIRHEEDDSLRGAVKHWQERFYAADRAATLYGWLCVGLGCVVLVLAAKVLAI